MKTLFFIIAMFFSFSCTAQLNFKLDYTYFGISFYPKKCSDTLTLPVDNNEFKNCNAKIFLEDCSGQCKFLVEDKNHKLRVAGYYSNALDTLRKYNSAKVMGKPAGKSYYHVSVLEYLSPLQTGLWIFYDKNGKEIYRTEYHFERN